MANNTTNVKKLEVTGAGETVSSGKLTSTATSNKSVNGLNSNADLQALTGALTDLYNNWNYTGRTAEERQSQAELEYQTYYDQLRNAAQQETERSDLALQQQRDALQSTYDRNRQQSAQQFAQTYSQADRQLLSRGMQRSSYAAQTLANVGSAAAAAQVEIDRQQAEAEGNIDAQRTQLASQLASKLAGYDANQASDVLKRVNELEQQDYDRSTTAMQQQASIGNQLYANMYQAQRDQITDNKWITQQNQTQQNTNRQMGWEDNYNTVGVTKVNPNGNNLYNLTKKKVEVSSGGSSGGGGSSSGGGKKKDDNKPQSTTDAINAAVASSSFWSNAAKGVSSVKSTTLPGR